MRVLVLVPILASVAALFAAGCGLDPASGGDVDPGDGTAGPRDPDAGTTGGDPSGNDSTDGGTADSGPARFVTLPPGAPLPSEADCAQRVRRSSFEPRPENAVANQTMPTADQLTLFNSETWDGMASRAKTEIRPRVTGAFTGTTDEIIQWAACKWGIDEDVVRAQAVGESWWEQSAAGDWTTTEAYCPPGTWTGTGCYQSYGLLQLKWRYHAKAAWPIARDSTAFNVDYACAFRRACLEGQIAWLGAAQTAGYPPYAPGDLWGCVGQWMSGQWYDSKALVYIERVQGHLAERLWEQENF